MSLSSVPAIKREFDLDHVPNEGLAPSDMERILVEAMKRDLPLAVASIHNRAHAQQDDADGWDITDPNSTLGKQLIRIFASDALRPLAAKHFAHGQELSFLNCCAKKQGDKPLFADLMRMQIAFQDGTLASADC